MKTTKEKADQDIHDNLVNNLQELLEKNYDAEKGFTKAMKDAKNNNLKQYFKYQAAQRSQFANELTNEIINLNETPKESGSTTGTLHRAWIDIKTSLSGDKDEAVLEECIRGEKASVEEYEERLKENRFPTQIESTLSNQKTRIQNTLNKVRTLEDLADNSWS
ncbi:ferritin-like domain-containing protein [Rasiella sp. SM2506]|uniref:ferritin-like domain-containing protein n=1 Tax=Rasiella sp. SM2506 TaxID=3423914 RepID=UPI003D7B02E4